MADTGYAQQNKLGDPRFTNNKVIAARVFNNKTSSRGYTPEAIDSHGTHVAGTVACNFETPTAVDGVTLPYKMSGVAPKALLGNYNVFPGAVGNARSEDILNALEAAYADGFDVANMSLGGGAAGVQDLLTVAVDNLDQANMVVAISNGIRHCKKLPEANGLQASDSALKGLVVSATTVDPVLYGAALKAADGQTVTLPQLGTYQTTGGNDVIADFTSWGPTDVDFRGKPDVMAPGVNVVSSIPRSYCGGAPCFASRTSVPPLAKCVRPARGICGHARPTGWAAKCGRGCGRGRCRGRRCARACLAPTSNHRDRRPRARQRQARHCHAERTC